jgi:hypothetical protein
MPGDDDRGLGSRRLLLGRMRPCFSFLAQQRIAAGAYVAQLVPRQRSQIPENPIDVPLAATPEPALFWKGREPTFECRQAPPRRLVEF